MHTLFEDQAKRTPQAPALVDIDGYLTYEELDLRAGLLAGHLRDLGMKPDEVVGVYLERSAAYVVACLAALKAGGAFLPLELAYPPSMLNEVIEDSRPRVVLTNEAYESNLPDNQNRFCLDEGWDRDLSPSGAPSVEPGAENLAFVSYSSGTTGKPKGIANPHRAAVHSYLWRFDISDNGPGDRVGCNVFFIWEMLRPLLRGATTVVIPDDVIYDPPALLGFLEEHEITETLMTPSLLESVLNAGGPEVGERLAALGVLWLNGEVVTRTLARRVLDLLPDTRVMNVYSISETHEVAAGDLRELYETGKTYCPVGAPLDAEHTHVLDEDKNPVSKGEAGELYVGGDCLARGYVNRPEITAQRFTKDPYSPEPEARMYRTGDRVRMLPGGNLEVLGRVDFMVKIRGYSVELGAVEAAIEKELAVYNCVAVADGEEGADKRLVAYLVPSGPAENEKRYAGWKLDAGTGRSPDLRNALRSSLPHYAIPSVFVELDALPLQATTGKVDREKLPKPPARTGSQPGRSVPAVSPETPRPDKETAMARLFEEVLCLDEGDVGRGDNFFDVGGHSLAAAELLGRVEAVFGARLPINVLLKDPTAPGLCEALETRLGGEPGSAPGTDPDSEPGPDLLSEAILDADIYPEREAQDTFILHRARRIFLTGATGFLGAFLLDSLILRTEATLYCLVRPREDGDLMAQIRANLEGYGLWRPGRARRIVPVVGDLESSLLGLSEKEFDSLSREIDVVIHPAARVNLAYPYEALKGANVDGTREVLRLACRHRAKHLHYVSTNGIFPAGGHRCEENADIDALADARNDGYGQTKWVAEKLVRQATLRGLPVSVYRPGNISGHSISGVSNPRDFLGAVIAESLRIGAVPNVEGWRVEMTPVDFVSGAICHLANEPNATGNTFHLAEPDPVPAEEVFGWLGEMGYALERLSYPDWLEARREASRPKARDDGFIGRVLDGADPGEHELWDGNVYDDSNTRQVLQRTGLRRPDINPTLLGNYARHFADRGWVEAPLGGGPVGGPGGGRRG
ncbi:MAG: amino acid adenylation domain-containing protein [Rubrobacteraceae bacterium]